MSHTRSLLGGIVVVGALLVAVFVNKARMPYAEEKERQLAAEMTNLVSPPDARLVDRLSTVKGSSVVVSAHFQALGNRKAVVENIELQLSERGWSICASGDHKYCKGDFQAVVEMRPNTAEADWDVACDLTWGLR